MDSSSSSSDSDAACGIIDQPLLLHRSSSSSDSEVELELIRRLRVPRTFRERPDNYNRWSDQEFFIRFRLQKGTVVHLLAAIENALVHGTNRNLAVSPMNQLLLTLRLYATGNMLIAVGDFAGVDKSTASRIVKKVTIAIGELSALYIHMPRNIDELSRNRMDFYSIARFPQIIGAIDCTHIRIQSPGGENAEYFRNRKGYFSINVQVVGDAALRIMDVVGRWPGSTHDQTIFNNSRIHARLERNEFQNNIIVGDSGYALKKYLITPILHPNTQAEQLFNEAQIRSRNPIERLFGVWKRRFPILSNGIRLALDTAQIVIGACAVLHNLAKDHNEEEPLVDPDVIVPAENIEVVHEHVVEGPMQRDFRRQFINYFAELR